MLKIYTTRDIIDTNTLHDRLGVDIHATSLRAVTLGLNLLFTLLACYIF